MNHYAEHAQDVTADHHIVSFSVACLPVPQPRQRHRVVRTAARTYAANYTPERHPVNGFKALLALEARRHYALPPRDGALQVRLRFRFLLPASARASLKAQVGLGRPWPHITKPDGDNLGKSCLDALTGIIWIDDKQLARLTVEKVYAREAGVDVWVGEYAG